MAKVLLLLALMLAACGGRTLGESSFEARGGGAGPVSGGTGGFVSLPGTGGVSAGTGGRSASGASPSAGGAPTSGGFAAGGRVSGGSASGGTASGGLASGGREACFETTQAQEGLCIHVRLCQAAQYETLCLMDTPSSAVCFCYTNGAVTSATSVLTADYDSLCEPAVFTHCP